MVGHLLQPSTTSFYTIMQREPFLFFMEYDSSFVDEQFEGGQPTLEIFTLYLCKVKALNGGPSTTPFYALMQYQPFFSFMDEETHNGFPSLVRGNI